MPDLVVKIRPAPAEPALAQKLPKELRDYTANVRDWARDVERAIQQIVGQIRTLNATVFP